jgi:hypothetical protein
MPQKCATTPLHATPVATPWQQNIYERFSKKTSIKRYQSAFKIYQIITKR